MSFSNSGSHTRNSVVYSSGANMHHSYPNSHSNSHSNSHISNVPLLYSPASQAMVQYTKPIESPSTTYRAEIYYDKNKLDEAKAEARAAAKAEAEVEISKIKQEAAAQAREELNKRKMQSDAQKLRERENMEEKRDGFLLIIIVRLLETCIRILRSLMFVGNTE